MQSRSVVRSGTGLAPVEERICFETCYAELRHDRLVIGNAHVERAWRIEDGLLYPISLRDKRSAREWLARAASQPSPHPASAMPPGARGVRLAAGGGVFGPTEAPSLAVELTASGATGELVYRFQLFPDASGISMQLSSRIAALDASPAHGEAAASSTGIDKAPANSGVLPFLDSMELFQPAGMHLRLVQVTLVDQSDVHNELVFENEWLVHSNEADLRLSGSLFALEDVLSGEGLVFLKHAPLPHARPQRDEYDLRLTGASASFWGQSEGFGPGDPRWPLTCTIGCYGHGIDASGGEGYRWVVLAYRGGQAGRTEALHTYQRQLRMYDPSRDGMFLSNTWGDRSRDTRINETFIRQEIDAAQRLGVDVVQIDDGWQRGRTSNSAVAGGVWQGFWAFDGNFWEDHPQRFPAGLDPVIEDARAKGLRFGLWFAPDSANDFANWQRDAAKILDLHRRRGIEYIKIDGVKARTRAGSRNLARFFHEVLEQSAGKVVFDLDVTAEVRPGYFAHVEVGPIFVENRYTDLHRYWPHQTLRNLWKLARWIDPLRLRMEFLNSDRNRALYQGDPLAPAAYRPAYLFATTMFANPLGWFEVSNLPEPFVDEVAALVRVWKTHRERIFGGRIHPIGEAPDGTAWTGFASVAGDGREGYVLLFRELNDRAEWSVELPMLATGEFRSEVLFGEGSVDMSERRMTARIPKAQDFLLARVGR